MINLLKITVNNIYPPMGVIYLFLCDKILLLLLNIGGGKDDRK